MKRSFQVTIPEDQRYFCPLEIKISSESAPNILNVKEYELLTSYKNKIDEKEYNKSWDNYKNCLLYTSPSPRDGLLSRMPSSA